MKNTGRLTIKFSVEEAGWATCMVECENGRAEMDASDVMNDPLSDMVEAATKLLRHRIEADFYLWEEPAECRWYLQLTNSSVELKIRVQTRFYANSGMK